MPINDSFAALGRNLRVAQNADQAEWAAIDRNFSSINSSLLDDRISGALDDESEGDRIEGDAIEEDELAGETLEQIELRQALLGDLYPFRLDGQVLHYTGPGSGVYEFCLQISLMDHSENQNSAEIVLFELMSAKAVADVFGGDFYRTGWPSHSVADRPLRFAEVGERLNTLTGEWIWQPIPPNAIDPPTTEVKDEGLDFVVWRRFDSRDGSFFVAGQCACGKNWRTKFNDLTWDGISRWWARPCHVQFTRALAVPYVVPGTNAIQDISRQAGLVFDRIRLSKAAAIQQQVHPWNVWIEAQRALIAIAA